MLLETKINMILPVYENNWPVGGNISL